MKSDEKYNIFYSMNAFGALINNIEKIRVDFLEDRLAPKIPFPHKHDFYHILLITEGKGLHEIDFIKYPVTSNAVFVMKPGQVHSWTLSANAKGYIIEFELSSLQLASHSFNFLSEILNHLPDYIKVTTTVKKNLIHISEKALAEMKDRKVGYETLSCLRIVEFLISLCREIPISDFNRYQKDEDTAQFLNLIEKHFKKQHQVEFYARSLGVATNALTMRVTRALGKPPRALIQNRCALEAKRMLGYTKIPVSQIGYELGFEDPNYFARFFKSQTGQTPLSFRKAVQS